MGEGQFLIPALSRHSASPKWEELRNTYGGHSPGTGPLKGCDLSMLPFPHTLPHCQQGSSIIVVDYVHLKELQDTNFS